MSFLCLPETLVVPEHPSLVVSVEDVRDFRATSSTNQILPFTTRRLSDHFVWITIEAKDGTQISVNRVEGPRCAQFQKLHVKKSYRPDRAAPIVKTVSVDSLVSITLQSRPLGWVQMEWAYSRSDLVAGRSGLDINGFGTGGRDAFFGAIMPFDTPRPMYVRITTLLPDRSAGGRWEGWIDRDGTFGSGLAKTFSDPYRPLPCPRGPIWDVPRGRFLVYGRAQTRYRARSLDGRVTRRAPLHHVENGTYELAVPARAGTAFWVVESAGTCHGPFRVATPRTRPRAVTPGQASEYGDVQAPEGIRFPIATPTLWWKLRVEWSQVPWPHAVPATTRTRELVTLDDVALEYGRDLAVQVDLWYVRLTPLFHDGRAGVAWTGRLVRSPKHLELVSD